VLSGLDAAMRGLGIDVYATAVLGQVERAAGGGRALRWSNAGHPPPVLLGPDGGVRLLETEPDVLLGLTTGDRADHSVPLEPGSALVLYTDGLVERRGIPMEERLDWLARALEGRQALNAEELCDHLVAALDDDVDDDVALLVLRVLPEP
jgi:serine phosphatase RsbU (regulator of sigma subunit)